VICRLSGGFIGDKQLPNNYVVIVVHEVFIENAIIVDPFNVNVDSTLGTIFFWSCKFLKHDMQGNTPTKWNWYVGIFVKFIYNDN